MLVEGQHVYIHSIEVLCKYESTTSIAKSCLTNCYDKL